MSKKREQNLKGTTAYRMRDKYRDDFMKLLYAKAGADHVPILEKPKSSELKDSRYNVALEQIVNTFLDNYYKKRLESEKLSQQTSPLSKNWSASCSSKTSFDDSGYNGSPLTIQSRISRQSTEELDQRSNETGENSYPYFTQYELEMIINAPLSEQEIMNVEHIKNDILQDFETKQQQFKVTGSAEQPSTSGLRLQQTASWSDQVANKPIPKSNKKKRQATRSYISAYQQIAHFCSVTLKFSKINLKTS
ncbi:hypothetical protein M3Y97_00041100 [Aphelenchoides bicaudatus]|nr:hypothetical protein M3Y97_00041100 [Aphelenchoides bicaudatus]